MKGDLDEVVKEVVSKFDGLVAVEGDERIQKWVEDIESNLGDQETHHRRMFQALALERRIGPSSHCGLEPSRAPFSSRHLR